MCAAAKLLPLGVGCVDVVGLYGRYDGKCGILHRWRIKNGELNGKSDMTSTVAGQNCRKKVLLDQVYLNGVLDSVIGS